MNTLTAPTTATADRLSVNRTAADWCFLAAWAIAVAGVGGWVLTLIPVWASKDEFHDRFLIPGTSVVLVWLAWPRIRSMNLSPTILGLVPLFIGSVLFSVTWYVAVQVSSRPIVVWSLTTSLILLIIGLALAHFGWAQAKKLIFPLLFAYFALPTPGRLYTPLTVRLKQFTTTAAQVLLPCVGVPVQRPSPDGFELKLKSGDLGIVEACSGVRSTIPLTAIAVLVAYVRRFRIVRSLLLVVVTIPIIAIVNAGRVIVTGMLQEFVGISAISGWKHEALGVSTILVGLGLIIAISSFIVPRGAIKEPEPGPPVDISQHGFAAMIRAGGCISLLLAALAACIWSEQFRINHSVYVKLQALPAQIGEWSSETLEPPEIVKDELKADQIVQRAYSNRHGQQIMVYVMFWASAASTSHQHHPDICYPYRGWKVNTSHMKPLSLADGAELPISVRHYIKPEQQQILFFWTQHGSHVLADGIEKPELMSGHSWILELLKHGHQPIDSGARISVLIGTATRGTIEPGERLLREFTTEFANALYDLCPWARPQTHQ